MAEGQSTRRRGAGAGPRAYSKWEWARAYTAWVILLPLYLGFWLFALLCPQLPRWVVRLLLRSHNFETERELDVRIPSDRSIPAYMLRWWKIPRNWAFNIYYHIVRRSDDDRALHDHPWWSFSIVLEGGYHEHMILPGGIHQKTWYGPGSVRFRPTGGLAHRLELETKAAHVDRISREKRIWKPLQLTPHEEQEELSVKTIFITGPVLRRWGFHDPMRGWVDAYDWDEHCRTYGITSIPMEGYAEQVTKKGMNQ